MRTSVRMKTIKTKIIIYVLLILLVALSGYLSYAHYIGSSEGVCLLGPNSDNDCSDVQSSKYGEIFGIKVSNLGLIAFTILLVIYIIANTKKRYHKNAHELFVLFAFIGALTALYFIFTQLLILKTLCSTCLIIDLTSIAVFILGYLESHKIRNA